MTLETSLNRTVSMINKYFDGRIPAYVEGVTEFDHALAQVAEQSIGRLSYTHGMELTTHVLLKQSGLWSLVPIIHRWDRPMGVARDEALRDQLASVMSRLAASLRCRCSLDWAVYDGN